MPSFFIPFSTLNVDGPAYTPSSRWNDMAVMENYDEAIPAPHGSAIPRRSLSTVTTPALNAKCIGAASFRDKLGRDFVFAATPTAIYRGVSTITTTFTFSNMSTGSYATSACASWEFASFPINDQSLSIIATNFTEQVQGTTIRASTTATFSNFFTGAYTPKCRHIGVINQFLVYGNTNTSSSATAAYSPSRIGWSHFNTPGNVNPSAANQSDYEDLATGGAVQKIIGGTEYGLVFQELQVQMMRYIGGTPIFDFTPLSYTPGTPAPNSVINYGGSVYYLAHDGFMQLQGTTLKRIGKDTVDRFFWNNVQKTKLHDITTCADPINKIIWWAYPTGTEGYAKRLLGYKFDDGRWTRWNQDVEQLVAIRRGLDSEMFCAFDTDHKLKTWTGAYATATFETKALQPVPGKRWQCNGVRIRMGGSGTMSTANVKARVYDTALPTSDPSYTTAVDARADHFVPMRVAGMYIKLTVTLNPGSATVDSYVGIDVHYELLGDR